MFASPRATEAPIGAGEPPLTSGPTFENPSINAQRTYVPPCVSSTVMPPAYDKDGSKPEGAAEHSLEVEAAITAALRHLKDEPAGKAPPSVSRPLVISPVRLSHTRPSAEAELATGGEATGSPDSAPEAGPASHMSASRDFEGTPTEADYVVASSGVASPAQRTEPPSDIATDADFVVTRGGTAFPVQNEAGAAPAAQVAITGSEPAPDHAGPQPSQSNWPPRSIVGASLAEEPNQTEVGGTSSMWRPPMSFTGEAARASLTSLAVDAGDRLGHSPAQGRAIDRRDYRLLARRALRFAVYAFAGWFAFVLALMVLYRFVNPPLSSLMLQQMLTGEAIAHEWVNIEDISPSVVRAVVASEDGRFCEHHGVDFDALEKAIDEFGTQSVRGASTISMQVVKNLFLWPSKSIVRKAIEFPLTFALELILPKRRIMEIYLNIAEWGPGIFGVGSAAAFHFRKAASRLSDREAARLAVALPNPIERNAGRPGPGTLRLARFLQFRMRAVSQQQLACVGRLGRR